MMFGTIKELIALYKVFKQDKTIFFWDGGSDRKKEIYPDYKKGRKLQTTKMNYDDVRNSLKLCQKIFRYVGLEQYRIKGEEGDDIIASYKAQNKGNKYYIYSSDHDFLQLLDKNTRFARKLKNELTIWNRKMFKKEYGFRSKYYPEYLSIVGDSTDKIPGVKGIGEVTGKKIFSQIPRPTIKEIYKNLSDVGLTENNMSKFTDSRKDVELFLQLTKLKEDLPLMPIHKPKQKPIKLYNLLVELECISIYNNEEDMEILCGLR